MLGYNGMVGGGYMPAYMPGANMGYMQGGYMPQQMMGIPQQAVIAPPIMAGQQGLPAQLYAGQQQIAPQQSQQRINDPKFREKIAEMAAEQAVEMLLEEDNIDQESEFSGGWSDHSRGGYGRAEVFHGQPQAQMKPRSYAVPSNDLSDFQKWIMYRVRGNEGHIDDVLGGQVGNYDMDSRQLDADTRVDALEYARGAEGKTKLDSEYFIRYGIPRVLQRMHSGGMASGRSIVSEASREEMDEFMQWLHWRTARNEAITTGHDVDGNALSQQSRQNALKYTRGGHAASDLNSEAFVQYGLPRLLQKNPNQVVAAPPSDHLEPKQKQKKKKLVKKVREMKVNYDEYLEQAINYALEYYYKNQGYYNQHLADLAVSYTGHPSQQKMTQPAIPAVLSQAALPPTAPQVPSILPVASATGIETHLQNLALTDGQNVTVPVVAAPAASKCSIRSAPSSRPAASIGSAKYSAPSERSHLSITPPRKASIASSSSSSRSSVSSQSTKSSQLDIVIKTGIDPPIRPPDYTDLQSEVAPGLTPTQSAFLYTTQFPNAEAALTKEYSLQPVAQNFSTNGSNRTNNSWKSRSHHSSEVQDILASQ